MLKLFNYLSYKDDCTITSQKTVMAFHDQKNIPLSGYFAAYRGAVFLYADKRVQQPVV